MADAVTLFWQPCKDRNCLVIVIYYIVTEYYDAFVSICSRLWVSLVEHCLQSGCYLVCTDQQVKVLHIQKKFKQYITMFHPLTAAALNFFWLVNLFRSHATIMW